MGQPFAMRAELEPTYQFDKQHAVEIALKDPEWGKWSDYKIAELCGVNQSTVNRHRASLMQSISDNDTTTRTYTTRHGTTTTMRTENIGRSQPRKESPKEADSLFKDGTEDGEIIRDGHNQPPDMVRYMAPYSVTLTKRGSP
jgi:hypothetical protein